MTTTRTTTTDETITLYRHDAQGRGIGTFVFGYVADLAAAEAPRVTLGTRYPTIPNMGADRADALARQATTRTTLAHALVAAGIG